MVKDGIFVLGKIRESFVGYSDDFDETAVAPSVLAAAGLIKADVDALEGLVPAPVPAGMSRAALAVKTAVDDLVATVPPMPVPPLPVILAVDFITSPPHATLGERVLFSAVAEGGTPPYAYAWTDGPHILGAGSPLTFTFHYVGVKHVMLTVTDAAGARAACAHDLTVT